MLSEPLHKRTCHYNAVGGRPVGGRVGFKAMRFVIQDRSVREEVLVRAEQDALLRAKACDGVNHSAALAPILLVVARSVEIFWAMLSAKPE